MAKTFDFNSTSYWRYFAKWCTVPHPSFYFEKFPSFLKQEITKLGYKPYLDSTHNIFFTIPATKGYENAPTVLLQGHTDMVAVAKNGVKFDFKKQPLKIKATNGWVHATGTTLGADDGIAIAYCLAIAADKKMPHPKLEILFSSNEEVTPQNINKFNTKLITAKYMINIDSEEMDTCYVGCASFGSIKVSAPIKTCKKQKGFNDYIVEVKNLAGGHSGAEISKLRCNAIKAVTELLATASKEKVNYQICNIVGAQFSNVIPSNSEIHIATCINGFKKINELTKSVEKKLNSIYTDDNKIKFSFRKANYAKIYINENDSKKTISLLNSLPHGVFNYDNKMKMFKSATNLWSAEINSKNVLVNYSFRETTSGNKNLIKAKIVSILNKNFKKGKCEMKEEGGVWTPKKNNKIFDIYAKVYKSVVGKTIPAKVCEGGLETANISVKKPNMDIISVGPDILGAHSSEEKININSADKMYKILLQTLKNII
ncbi:MAG: beta-Ala-His dipeptidase [Mycoplasmataceae bacterium]|nr:beta-Ala-His dipeptidase [Mycoplasmataceae bacterium]